MSSGLRKWGWGWVLLLAAILRCIALQSRGIQYDDAFSFFLASRSLAEIVRGTAADTMPPLYYFLLHFWMLINSQLYWLRLLSVLLNLACIYFFYALVCDQLGNQAAFWAGMLAALSPVQIYHAQDLRMYALVELAQIGYVYCFLKIEGQKQSTREAGWLWGGLVVSGAAALYSHNLAAFVLVVPNIILLVQRRWQLLGRLVAAQVMIGVLTLPWLWLIPGQVDKIQRAFWTPRPGIVEIIQTLLIFTTNLPLPGMLALAAAAVVALQVLLLVGIDVVRQREKRAALGWLTAFGLIPPGLLFIVSYVMRPVFVPRGFLFSSLMFYGLAGAVIARAKIGKDAQGARQNTGPGVLVAGLLLLSMALSLPYQYSYASFPRSPFRQAAAWMRTESQPGELILHDNKLSAFPMIFEAPDLPQAFLADEAGSTNDTYAPASQEAMQIFPQPDLTKAVEGKSRLFFVVFDQTIAEYQSQGEPDHPVVLWLEQRYPHQRIQQFNDLRVIEFWK